MLDARLPAFHDTELVVRSPAERAGRRILMFDSGLGGLSVLREINAQVSGADVIYVADDAGFPYGVWSESALVAHVVALMGELIAHHRPDLIVVACNTASTLVLPSLRAAYDVPIVGTVPAIKPAAEITKSGLISVLATPGTVARDYTRQLIATYAGETDVTLIGSSALAGLAEDWLRGQEVPDDLIRAEIAPCFRTRDTARTDVIVLGCTHYPLLIERFRRLSPWDVTWIDGAAAIARRAAAILTERHPTSSEAFFPETRDTARLRQFSFTSGQSPSVALQNALRSFGF